MTPRHAALGVLVAALWGFNFVAARLALSHFSPLMLVALRFGVAALPALFLPRPKIAWPMMGALASSLFIGQFSFLFWGMHAGMPPGLASVLTQFQAVLTVVLAWAFLREKPTTRQIVGLLVATAGLAIIGCTVGRAGVTLSGLILTLLAAASWAVGNVLLRSVDRGNMLALIVWLSVIPPFPTLLLSTVVERPFAVVWRTPADLGIGLLALLYVSVAATLGGYAAWGYLLRLYPARSVAPFGLLVPVFGVISAWLTLGEQFSRTRLCGVAALGLGLAISSLPVGKAMATLIAAARGAWSMRARLPLRS